MAQRDCGDRPPPIESAQARIAASALMRLRIWVMLRAPITAPRKALSTTP